MNTSEQFYKNYKPSPVDNKVIQNGVLTITTYSRLDYDNRQAQLVETYKPYEKEVEVDGLVLKIGLIKYNAKFYDKFGELQSQEEKSLFLGEQFKRDVLWWHTEAMSWNGNNLCCQLAAAYADVLHDLDLSDIQFIKKYESDFGRDNLGRRREIKKWQGVKNGYQNFEKKYREWKLRRKK